MASAASLDGSPGPHFSASVTRVCNLLYKSSWEYYVYYTSPQARPRLGTGRQTMAVQFIRSDLEFILDQIVIAERNAAGESLLDLLANVTLPFGLRTVDGTLNNIVPTQSQFG